MSDNKISILSEKFDNEKTGEQIEGITIMIDGKLKNMLDIIIEKEGTYNNYTEVIKDLVFAGINQIVEKYKRQNSPLFMALQLSIMNFIGFILLRFPFFGEE